MKGEIALALALGLSILFGAFLIAYKPVVEIWVHTSKAPSQKDCMDQAANLAGLYETIGVPGRIKENAKSQYDALAFMCQKEEQVLVKK